jgi:hypothetical protein
MAFSSLSIWGRSHKASFSPPLRVGWYRIRLPGLGTTTGKMSKTRVGPPGSSREPLLTIRRRHIAADRTSSRTPTRLGQKQYSVRTEPAIRAAALIRRSVECFRGRTAGNDDGGDLEKHTVSHGVSLSMTWNSHRGDRAGGIIKKLECVRCCLCFVLHSEVRVKKE